MVKEEATGTTTTVGPDLVALTKKYRPGYASKPTDRSARKLSDSKETSLLKDLIPENMA
jgi:hypothetical protein